MYAKGAVMEKNAEADTDSIHKGIEALEKAVRVKSRAADTRTSKKLDLCLTAFLSLFLILSLHINE